MTGSGGRLAAALVAVWGLVHVVSQELATPPLDVGWTILIGVVLSTTVVLGYPSALRGPRGALASRRHRGGRRGPDSRTLDVVERTAPYLRRGLTVETASRTVQLLRPVLGGDSVAITDHERILGFTGPGADHHLVGSEVATEATRRVLASGRTLVVRRRKELGCSDPACPLRSAVIAPLRLRDQVVGTLKVYRTEGEPVRRSVVEAMTGVLSLHLELAEVDRQSQLAADARLDSLRAQISPHFLFNTLNTIASKARTDPEEARQLLLRLSDFFRYSTQQQGQFADFAQEYFFVRTYLTLEQARFGDRLRIRYDIDPQVLGVQVPVLTIQPLAENAVKHGLAPKVDGGTVAIRARVDPLGRAVAIQVRDDGVGIPDDVLAKIRIGADGADPDAGGIGLANIGRRLDALFGKRHGMDVRSREGEGTTVSLRIPLR